MDLNTGQRKAVFGVVVVALAGLGVYMFVPGGRGGQASGSPRAAAHSPAPRATSPAAPAASPSPAAAAATPSDPDIYQWLPFSQAQLGSAAAVVSQFCDAYGTWSYSQNATTYVATMRNLITSELADVIAQGYAVPGVAGLRTSKKQVSTGSAVINSLRAFGTSSITFVVTITEQITDTAGRSLDSTQYAVTVVGIGSSWQVNDIELASAGNS
jgi:hypothetical protein